LTQSGFVEAPISSQKHWSEGLLTLELEAEIDAFDPGQFVNLALPSAGELLRRPYSLASAPGARPQFYLTRVEDGSLTPRLFELPLGSRLLIERKAQGFFTLRYVPDCRSLWLVATGTGLGPFISMLRSGEIWRRFPRVVVVHGVRSRAELGYADELSRLVQARAGQLDYVPSLSREAAAPGMLPGRVTSNLASGALEQHVGLELGDDAHLMLCGNPQMIADVTAILHGRGLRKHRVRQPGHYTVEKYWD
jgi:ferredoxin/flavodoxin---NADP+ reductase